MPPYAAPDFTRHFAACHFRFAFAEIDTSLLMPIIYARCDYYGRDRTRRRLMPLFCHALAAIDMILPRSLSRFLLFR